ncbi:Glutathione peroxidase 1 [Microtus ochrogaster]|uniref:Glutathione peroxidase 1 n=1 Tax=Microtus ochrogaster TaxID=79684 RepID=A0A8J6H2S5_MICOH|nr:Glutathione peroxidase 1 [Microtus ochrogaster]
MNNLQRRLGPRGLVVLGFPCNQFGHQENAKNEEILNSLKYIRPVREVRVCHNDIAWNFEKFLVGPDGVPVGRYSRRFRTIDIEPDIEALLSQQPSGS